MRTVPSGPHVAYASASLGLSAMLLTPPACAESSHTDAPESRTSSCTLAAAVIAASLVNLASAATAATGEPSSNALSSSSSASHSLM